MWRMRFEMIVGLLIAGAALMAQTATAEAQRWSPWGNNSSWESQRGFTPPYQRGYRSNSPFWDDWFDDDDEPRRPMGPKVLDGGGRPSISPIAPQSVSFPSSYTPGSIIIDTRGKQLFYVQTATTALRYPISVGRVGFTWTGTQTISRKADWPDWYPPAEMRERDPRLPEKMTGGLRNPLGAKALYLGNTLYRIHGTNDAKTIGQAASSGCFRMLNGHVIDLASRVDVGTSVTVVSHLPPNLAKVVGDQVNRRARVTDVDQDPS
ncbi:MAG: L,D-transpeptidase [Hyphomicrobiaceae bacterium]